MRRKQQGKQTILPSAMPIFNMCHLEICMILLADSGSQQSGLVGRLHSVSRRESRENMASSRCVSVIDESERKIKQE